MLLATVPSGAVAQEPGRIRIEVRAGGGGKSATVVAAGTSYLTDTAGAVLALAPAGDVQVTVAHEGFVPVIVSATVGVVRPALAD